MLKTKDQVAKALGEHYSAKFNGKVTCFYDEDEGKFCIQGSKLPSEIYKSGWQLLDHIGPFEAFDILGIEPQTETPAYTLFRHVTAGGAEYLTDNHMFADATLVIRLDGGAELVTCEGMKPQAPEVQGDRALLQGILEWAEQIEDDESRLPLDLRLKLMQLLSEAPQPSRLVPYYDVKESYRLAMDEAGIDAEITEGILQTVEDYCENHHGDD
jgi:hypothetical protein